jgi:hypothetical protein
MRTRYPHCLPLAALAGVAAWCCGCVSRGPHPDQFLARARLLTAAIQEDYWDPDRQHYLDTIPRRTEGLPYAMMWGNGMQFTVLTAAARHDPGTYAAPLRTFLNGLERYWNPRRQLYSAYLGGTEDCYYDDNQWVALACVEAHESTRDPAYLEKARTTLDGCLAGVDAVRGGGSYWHVDTAKYPTKNTCSNAPLATALLRVARHLPDGADRSRYVATAEALLVWTRDALQDERGLMLDHLDVKTGASQRWTFTYNTALMLEGWLELHAVTHDPAHLAEAQRLARASTHWLQTSRHSGGRVPLRGPGLLRRAPGGGAAQAPGRDRRPHVARQLPPDRRPRLAWLVPARGQAAARRCRDHTTAVAPGGPVASRCPWG